MRRRPTKRAATVAAVAILLVLVGSTAQAGWLFVLAAGVFGLIGGSLLLPHRLGAIELERELPPRARVGDDIRVGITARNAGAHRSPLMSLEDRFGAFDPAKVALESLAPGATGRLELVRRPARRGVFASGEVTLVSAAPFGLVRSQRRLSVASNMVVVPRWVELRSFPLLEPASFPSEQLHERARTGAGEEFLGVREYRPGDPRRHIHWRSTARLGRLVVREFEEEATSRVAVVVAGADAGDPPDSAFELLVSAAASIAVYSIMTGHRVELLRAGEQGPERLTDPEQVEVLDWLADAEPMDSPLQPLIQRALLGLGRRGTVVILSPTTGSAGRDVTAAVRSAQSAGSRAIAVVAKSSTWDPKVKDEAIGGAEGGRSRIKLLSKDADLLQCLEA